jgi:CheY-like chemotaxis protein
VNTEAVVKFADLVDGVLKLAVFALAVFAVVRLLPEMRRRGFSAKVFGSEVTLNGPTDAVETLSDAIEKQIDDLRTQVTGLQSAATSRGPGGLVTPSGEPANRELAFHEVLWVDDRPANNLFETGKLREAGARVTVAITTREAIEALEQKHFDVVITDMQRREDGRDKPEAGIELIDRISENHQDLPVYVYCGKWAVETLGGKARARGARGATASTTQLLEWVLPRRADSDTSVRGEPTPDSDNVPKNHSPGTGAAH